MLEAVTRIVFCFEIVDQDDGAEIGIENQLEFLTHGEVIFPMRIQVEELSRVFVT